MFHLNSVTAIQPSQIQSCYIRHFLLLQVSKRQYNILRFCNINTSLKVTQVASPVKYIGLVQLLAWKCEVQSRRAQC